MGRLRGCIWLTAGLVVALIAGVVGYMTLTRVAGQRTGQEPQAPQVQVVVASKALEVRSVLTATDVQLKGVPVNTTPEGAAQKIEDVVGKLTLVELYPGEIILAPRLLDPNVTTGDGHKAIALEADKVLMAFPANDLMSRSGVLKPGDHVDLYFSLKFKLNQAGSRSVSSESGAPSVAVGSQTEQLATFDVLQNGVISALVAGKTSSGGSSDAQAPEAILLAVNPQDALVLKYVKDAEGVLDAVLRAPGAEAAFPVEPVDQDYVLRKYRVPLLGGQ
jgi:pilus assembly protein CpaB